jgi:S-adenosylmethionine decarboxylase
VSYSGVHLLADLHGCSHLADAAVVAEALRGAAAAAGATLLELRLHGFGPGLGVTGVALLAESHISIHTWPEHAYAAVDIFLCGDRHDLAAGLKILTDAFAAERWEERRIARGFSALALAR